jgi:hypothetical protein
MYVLPIDNTHLEILVPKVRGSVINLAGHLPAFYALKIIFVFFILDKIKTVLLGAREWWITTAGKEKWL